MLQSVAQPWRAGAQSNPLTPRFLPPVALICDASVSRSVARTQVAAAVVSAP